MSATPKRASSAESGSTWSADQPSLASTIKVESGALARIAATRSRSSRPASLILSSGRPACWAAAPTHDLWIVKREGVGRRYWTRCRQSGQFIDRETADFSFQIPQGAVQGVAGRAGR